MTSTKPTPNPRGNRPLEGVGIRMGWLAHALPTEAKSGRGKGVSGRGELPNSPPIPDHAGPPAPVNPPRTAIAIPRAVCRNGSRLGAVPAPVPAARVIAPALPLGRKLR